MQERLMQDLLIHFPSEVLEEEGIRYFKREVQTGNNRLDIVLIDRRGRHVLVEVQSGSLDTKHIDRHIDYSEGYLKNNPNVDIRIIFMANHIDIHRKTFLQRRGYEYLEVSEHKLNEIIQKHDFKIEMNKNIISNTLPIIQHYQGLNYIKSNVNTDQLIWNLKDSQSYKYFKAVLPKKINNELKAKEIILNNLGSLSGSHLQAAFTLVDEPYSSYPPWCHDSRPWFGRLLKPNANNMINEKPETINQWFSIICDAGISPENKINLLQKGQKHYIKGASVGLITLILYLLDKVHYSVWFKGQHDGLAILDPRIGEYSGSSRQYVEFNRVAKEFARRYDFADEELDFLFSWAFPRIKDGKLV